MTGSTPTSPTSPERSPSEPSPAKKSPAGPIAAEEATETAPAPPELPRLHVPDEPVVMKAVWRGAVLDGTDLEEIVTGGVAGWLWSRWRALEAQGFKEAGFDELVGDYRREVWLWLVGDRTWEQCCSGLIGRISRRVPS